ncbi:unnamed protein product, partial [Mesorhabditis belari]|uniref:Uncharacterized protein n=1 Tax=Mesorhabditis belari TaxID=2138241 RepID=A0AAF3EI18_9BILA
MLYDLEFDPKLLDRRQSDDEISSTKGSLRTYHWGVSANVTPPLTMILDKKVNSADFTFHIHEQLLTEAVAVLCQGLIEKEFSTPSISTLKLSCNGVPRVNVSENQEKNKILVTVPLKAELYEKNERKIFEYEKDLFTRLMYQQNFGKFIFYLQVLSEKISGDEAQIRFHYGREIYLHLVEMFKKYVTLPLPTFVAITFFEVDQSL